MDNKKEGFNGELHWRLKFEQFLSACPDVDQEKVPMVAILLNGGPTALEASAMRLKLNQQFEGCEQTEKHINIPLIVVKGSGRAADMIAELHETKGKWG